MFFFLFDVVKYPSSSDNFTGFKPLNLNNWGKNDFDHLDIKYILEWTGSVEQIRVIRWRLDEYTHARHIHDMFNKILSGRA